MNTSVGGIRRLGMRALLVDDEITQETATGRAVRTLSAELAQRDIDVLTATSADDAIMLIRSDPSIQCVLLDWDLGVGGPGPAAAGGGPGRPPHRQVALLRRGARRGASAVPGAGVGPG
ncbi:Orn/Lys/Arg decarboxylase N-terminal domain-containing protein, partial [Burkholderia cepacia]|uniref:Orn/Lys/Arg decarboxylase N-terminal domain-containing protein n=1 Tax=Burkholderia cepacia TaxID=292 RepID=UPI0028F3EDE6